MVLPAAAPVPPKIGIRPDDQPPDDRHKKDRARGLGPVLFCGALYRPIQLPQASLPVQSRSQKLVLWVVAGPHLRNENGENLKIVKNLQFLFTAFVIAVSHYHGDCRGGENLVNAGKDTRWT